MNLYYMKPMSSNIVPHSARISVLATLWSTAAEGVEKSTQKSSWPSCSATRARARLSRRQIGTITRRRVGGDVWVGPRCTIRSNIMYINIYNIYIDWGSYGIIIFYAGNPNLNQPIGRWRVWTPLGCSWWFIRQSTSLTCWCFMAVENEMCYQETSMFTISMACFRWIWFIVCWWSLAANDLPRSWASDSDLGVFSILLSFWLGHWNLNVHALGYYITTSLWPHYNQS